MLRLRADEPSQIEQATSQTRTHKRHRTIDFHVSLTVGIQGVEIRNGLESMAKQGKQRIELQKDLKSLTLLNR